MAQKKNGSTGLKTGHTVGPHDCRYIVGEVGQAENTFYCGRPVQAGSPYCEDHHRACYDGKGKVHVPFHGYPKK